MTGGVITSYDLADQDFDLISDFICGSYWGVTRSPEQTREGAANSYVVGLFEDGRQLGFGRAISDRRTTAYLLDVFVVADRRGNGLALRIVRDLMAHPMLCDVPVWMLSTRDAHGLYKKLGFAPTEPGRVMRFERADIAS